jgi:signal transduction histidine kinase
MTEKKPLKILLVEDNPAHVELVIRAFKEQDGSTLISIAGSLSLAREMLASKPIDLIIADWRLPDGEGIDLLSIVSNSQGIPVLYMTSYGSEQIAVDVMKAGAVDYVVKSQEVLADMPHIAERAYHQWSMVNEQKRIQHALKQSESRYRQLSQELELRVEQRTYQLQQANKELEAFVYSVSHDLKAPLRGIDGYSRILEQDFSKQLGEEGIQAITRIRQSVNRMNHLIDDLLQLSRLTRGEMIQREIDMSALAQTIAQEVASRTADTHVNFTCQAGLYATGDPRLIRLVVDNLFDNAWKFTAHHSTPQVEFGAKLSEHGDPIFFVRDNGIGFDMKYADRIFEPFHRLVRVDEYEGSGIGLATVQRIIIRHGGRIWIESEPDQGATFYFTLPGE